jgi:hypothetical protein
LLQEQIVLRRFLRPFSAPSCPRQAHAAQEIARDDPSPLRSQSSLATEFAAIAQKILRWIPVPQGIAAYVLASIVPRHGCRIAKNPRPAS